MHNRAVFLDRDGVLNEDHGYISSPAMMHVLPGAGAALVKLREAGYLLVLVTNQSGVARGMFREDDLEAIHSTLADELAKDGATLDAVYYCPHLPEGAVPRFARPCDCRKPSPGMLLSGASDLNIDLADSFMVGDTLADIEAGRTAGCHTILIAPEGYDPLGADAVATDLAAAAELIVDWNMDG